MPTKVIFIRHGHTTWNTKGRYCGLSDIELNTKGKRQARQLYRIMRKQMIDDVYSSDSRRALNFAEIVFKGSHIKRVTELREMDFGIFEGLTYDEIMTKYAKVYKRWLENPFAVVIPDGESLKHLKDRTNRALSKIVSRNKNKVIAIVTHAGPIKMVLSSILKTKDIWKLKPDLGSLNIVEFRNNRARIMLLNDTSYLNG